MPVFRQYGLTETGYGGALSCGEGRGMHVMEDGFFFEIVSPGTGELLPDGEEGEIVCTAFRAEGTPFCGTAPGTGEVYSRRLLLWFLSPQN